MLVKHFEKATFEGAIQNKCSVIIIIITTQVSTHTHKINKSKSFSEESRLSKPKLNSVKDQTVEGKHSKSLY